MNGFWRCCAASAFVVFLGIAAAPARADPSLVFPPLHLPGPYPVACSNVSQDFTRLAPGEDVQAYWEGVPRADGSQRYVTDLLSDAPNTLSVVVNAPNDGNVYGSFAGRAIPYVVLVCYPTAADNPRPDYALPTGRTVPHMQRGSDSPLWPDATTRFPLLAFSHGYIGSPISNDYVNAIAVLASFGYVVAAPFHGDPRFAPNLVLENVGDIVYLILHLRDFLALQALRPLSMSATLDLLLANPLWRDHIDATKIGGFGASLGGETMLLMVGAGLTTSLGLSVSTVATDSRLKAAVGYVPYFGQPIFPAFGRDQYGLDGVTLPYLAISGTADTTAPIIMTFQGLQRLAGPRELVALNGVKHGFDIPSTDDIFTWTLTFLDAEVRGDAAAQAKLAQMASVAGGGDDHVVLPWNAAAPINYGGMWWNAPAGSEPGWGVNVVHEGDLVFATWLTYDPSGRSLWLSLIVPRIADRTYAGTIYRTSGPAFSAIPFDPSRVTVTAVGSGTLTFADATSGSFAYSVSGAAQTKAITRYVFGPAPTCVFGAQPNLALATNYQDLWWNAPGGSEAGWGVNVMQQGDLLFAALLVYDLDGAPLWLTATAPKTGPGTFTGTLYRTTGPSFATVPFNPSQVTATPVGSVSFAFADGNRGTLVYTLSGVAVTKQITRDVLVSPGTVCQ